MRETARESLETVLPSLHLSDTPPRELTQFRCFEAGNSHIWIFRPRSAAGRGVVIKKLKADRAAAAAEFNTLRFFEERLAGAGDLHVPHPVGFFGDDDVLVTEEVIGRGVDQLLVGALRRFRITRRPQAFAEAQSACTVVGRWLTAIHGLPLATPLKRAAHSLNTSLRRRYDEARQRIRGIGVRFGPELSAMHDYFVRSLPDSAKGESVLIHPDFAPHNMLLAREGLYVLDVADVTPGHPFEDASFFWAHLESMKLTVVFDRRRTAVCQEAFLRAAAHVPTLPVFWQRWGMLMRLSYLSRSWQRAGKLTGIRLMRRNQIRRAVQRWLTSQSWDDPAQID